MNVNTNIFSFTKYVQPGWYFWLHAPDGRFYWVDVRKISIAERKLIDLDSGYVQEESMLRDAAHQLLLKGYIATDPHLSLSISGEAIPVVDEYRFLRRYYHGLWSWYVLFLRCLGGHNPFREWRCFLRTRKVKRVSVYTSCFSHTVDYEAVKDSSLVSIVIPTLNRYAHLEHILRDIEKQTLTSFEVVVIDQSDPFRPEFYTNFNLPLRVIHQYEPGLWKARNRGIRESNGKWIAFSEDDVRVEADWLEKHLACVTHFEVDVSAGIFFAEGSQMPIHKAHFRWAEQFATGNALVHRSVFERVGLFDMQFERMRMGDGEFGLRAYLSGIRSISNPQAFALDVKASQGGLRQMGSWDSFRPTSVLAPRPVPSVLYLLRRYFGNTIARLDLLIKIPMSIIPFRYKKNSGLFLLGGIVAILILPLVLIQVFRSWRKSSVMLRQGPQIESLLP